MHHRTIQINPQPDATIFQFIILTFVYSSPYIGRFYQFGDLFELNVKLRCQKIKQRSWSCCYAILYGTAYSPKFVVMLPVSSYVSDIFCDWTFWYVRLGTAVWKEKYFVVSTEYHIISYHIISYHIISYHIISYHIITYHTICSKIAKAANNSFGIHTHPFR